MSSNGAYARYTANQNPYDQSSYGGASSSGYGGGYGGGYGSGPSPGYGSASYSSPTYRGPTASASASSGYAQVCMLALYLPAALLFELVVYFIDLLELL
jgi:hypothetical protein